MRGHMDDEGMFWLRRLFYGDDEANQPRCKARYYRSSRRSYERTVSRQIKELFDTQDGPPFIDVSNDLVWPQFIGVNNPPAFIWLRQEYFNRAFRAQEERSC